MFSAHIWDLVGALTRGVGLYRVSTSGVRPCPPKITNGSSGRSLKAKAVIPDIPHGPMNSKPVVFKESTKSRSTLAMMEMGCVSGGRKAQDSYYTQCSIYLQDVTQVAFSPVFH